MKKILLLLSILTFSFSFAYAQEDIIDVELSSKNIDLDERVKYIINISQDTPGKLSGELKIPGLENFNIFSQQSGHSFESINGVSTGVSQYTFDMSPKSEGEFSIGPVEIQSASGAYIDDEKLVIRVGDRGKQESTEITQANNTDQKSGEDQNIEADFYTLREREQSVWFYVVGTLLFLVIFYLLLSLALGTRRTQKEEKGEILMVEPQQDFHDEMKSYFVKLEKKSSSLESSDFLKIFNHGIRRILQREISQDALSLTLSQLKEYSAFKNFELSKLFSKSYNAEYSQKNITDITKRKYIDEVKEYLN